MTYAHKKIRALTDGVRKRTDPDHDCRSGIFAFCQPQTEFVSTLFKNNLKQTDQQGAGCKNSVTAGLCLSSPIFALRLLRQTYIQKNTQTKSLHIIGFTEESVNLRMQKQKGKTT